MGVTCIFFCFFGLAPIFKTVVSWGCPDEDPMLLPWSLPTSWPSNKIPEFMEDATIDTDILLDISPPELRSINITSSGRLVWGSNGQHELRTNYILIHGALEIGNEDCRFTEKATITLTGKIGQHNISRLGEKFLGVARGGTLEIHGEGGRVPWTKLNKTLPKLTVGHGYIFKHKESTNWRHEDWMEGFAAYVVNPITDTIENFRMFYLSGNNAEMTGYHIPDVEPFLLAIQPGSLLFLSVQHTLLSKSDLSVVYDALESFLFGQVTGNSLVRTVKDQEAYVLIAKAGDPNFVVEGKYATSSGEEKSHVSKNITLSGLQRTYVIESSIDLTNYYESYIDFRILDTEYLEPVLDVIDDVSTWKPGDKVFLTSTDFSWQQVEEADVLPCFTCKSNQVKVRLETQYTHWGEIVHNVDMRAEVALLTRNVLIRSVPESVCMNASNSCDATFGGHLKVLPGFKNVHIEGAELVNMGTTTDVGRYPIHFHLAGNVSDKVNYSNTPYVRENSIHHSFSKCITVHGTSGLQVIDNVCYDCIGHGFYFEDGDEMDVVLDGNLGASTRPGHLTPGDRTPSTFWITNPRNVVRNNVAAGSEHTGFWFVFPDKPIGLSAQHTTLEENEAWGTKLTEVSNNVAHSNLVAGFNLDQKLLPDFSAGLINEYNPKEDPRDKNSPDKETEIYRLTCYKNNMHNVWLRGGRIRLGRASLADSARGLTFARCGNQEQIVENSVILGETSNIGEPSVVWHQPSASLYTAKRSLVIPWDHHYPVMGFAVYDGPVYLNNIWFNNFKHNMNYTMAAIGFQLQNEFASSAVSGGRRLEFGFTDDVATGNRFFDGDETIHGFWNFDGDKGATFRDLDGSLTSLPQSQIVKPTPFYTTPTCVVRKNWNMAVCPYKYGKLSIHILDALDTSEPIMVRDDVPEIAEHMYGNASHPEFNVILGGNYSYTLHWSGSIPSMFQIDGFGVELGFHVRIGVCLSRNARFDLRSWAPSSRSTLSDWTLTPSLNELDDDGDDVTGGKYFWDPAVGLLFLKFQSFKSRLPETKSDCNGLCPVVVITLLEGQLDDSDCRARAYPKYTRKQPDEGGTMIELHSPIPATSATPDSSKGAGATKPFDSRQVVDGNFGQWSVWSSCSVTCGDGRRKRTRMCDDPRPQNGGSPCHGDNEEAQACSSPVCPTDGGFSEWSHWSACQAIPVSECTGYQHRHRQCDEPSPQNRGSFCNGCTSEVRPCNVCDK